MIILIFIPESPKWLYKNERFEECYKILEKTARFNGTELKTPQHIFAKSDKIISSINSTNKKESRVNWAVIKEN